MGFTLIKNPNSNPKSKPQLRASRKSPNRLEDKDCSPN